MSDPKLKQAMAEIKGILNRHDIAGQVTLVSQTHSEFLLKPDTSWSCVHFDGEQLRIRVKKSEIPDKEVRRRLIELSAHILLQIRDLNAQNFRFMEQLLKMLEQHVEIDHTPYSGFEPHREQ